MRTAAPSAASLLPTTHPMPEAPPVTMAVLSRNRFTACSVSNGWAERADPPTFRRARLAQPIIQVPGGPQQP